MKTLSEVARQFHRDRMTPKRPTLPAAQLRPAAPTQRAPRAMLGIAQVLLLQRDLTREQLAEQLQTRYPNQPIWIDNLLTRLQTQELVAEVGGVYGLTPEGEAMARKLDADPLHGLAHPASTGHQRRLDAAMPGTDPALLTRSQGRKSASAADTTAPPLRAGADQANQYPSRIGDRRHYRDGRVTDLQGRPLRIGY